MAPQGRDHMLANRHLTAQVARLNEELTAGREFWRAFDTDQRARLIQLKEQQLETNSREADPHSVQDLVRQPLLSTSDWKLMSVFSFGRLGLGSRVLVGTGRARR